MMLKENDEENEICNAPSTPTTKAVVTSVPPTPSTAPPLEATESLEDRDDKQFIYDSDTIGSQRVYKKTSSNQLLTLYLGSRELVSRHGTVESLKGVIFIDPRLITGHKIYGQLTLTFRYGREDEEVMGLKFCNEAVIALKQLWPKTLDDNETLVPLQEALIERLGRNAVAFSIDVATVVPPSVQLLPAKRYTGAPIGTSYDVRVYTAEPVDERVQRRSTVKLGIRLIHKICPIEKIPNELVQPMTGGKSLRLRLSPKALKLSHKHSHSLDSGTNPVTNDSGKPMVHFEKKPTAVSEVNKGPEGSVEKPFLWAEGRVSLKAKLNKSAYTHGEHLTLTIDVRNDSRKVVRKIRIFAVQHVDVCMFSNGKFKNIVADLDISKQIGPGETMHGIYSLLPVRGSTKNWIAVEGALFNTSSTHDTSLIALNSKLASSAPRGPQTTEEKNVFAIYVSYYIKVKLTLSGMGGEVTLKLPFVLGNVEYPEDLVKAATLNVGGNNENGTKKSESSEKVLRKQSASVDSVSKPMLSRLDRLKSLKFSENMSSSIDIITEELNNIHNKDKNKLTRSDSSRSNLNDDELYENDGNIVVNVIQAQVHHHHAPTTQPPPPSKDNPESPDPSTNSKFSNSNSKDGHHQQTEDEGTGDDVTVLTD